METEIKVPTFDQLMNPLLKALRDLGGSGSIDEIYAKVTENLNLPDEVLNILHNPERSNTTEVGYRLGWVRTYLKHSNYLENSSRGVWSITPDKAHLHEVNPRDIVQKMQSTKRALKRSNGDQKEFEVTPPEESQTWRERLFRILTKEIDPSTFERLIKRLLRESGFVQVEVTGKTGDGGIDGKGIARINGILSFHVIFQCKRYQGSVSASAIRDFRGAMVGRADKGLFVTTGSFTREAIKEATRDGAPPIDLIDGEQLADKLKELSLGIQTKIETKVVETISIDENWFRHI